MAEFGPIQLSVIGFLDLGKLQGNILTEIFRLSVEGPILVIGLHPVAKDEN